MIKIGEALRELGRTVVTGKSPQERLMDRIIIEQPDLMRQTYGQARQIMDSGDMEAVFAEYNVWQFAGTIGGFESRALPAKPDSANDFPVNENISYIRDMMEAYREWEDIAGTQTRFYFSAESETHREDSGQLMMDTKFIVAPSDSSVTLKELIDTAANFRNYANDKLKDIYGGYEL